MHLKKNKPGRTRRIIIWVIFIVACLFAAWQNAVLVSWWHNIQRARNAPDVASALRSLRRETFGILCKATETTADDCYVFDADGVVFGTARMVVGDAIARIDDASSFKLTIGEPFIDLEIWKNLTPIVSAVRSGELPASALILKRAERELAVTLTPTGMKAYFSLEFSPEKHLRALKELEKKVKLETLEYVDLRIEGKIFYKEK